MKRTRDEWLVLHEEGMAGGVQDLLKFASLEFILIEISPYQPSAPLGVITY
jgi:hypothetical protein